MNLDKTIIIGVGLIGASIGLALKKKNMSKSVLGIGNTKKNLETAKNIGAIDDFISFPKINEIKPDVIILATPIQKTIDYIKELTDLKFNCILMDVTSSKNEIFYVKPNNLVSVHPMAGAEKSGAYFAQSTMFDKHPLIIINDDTPLDLLNFADEFWTNLGAGVIRMSLTEHNKYLACLSHLPHLLSYCIAEGLSEINNEKASACAGPGFESFIRLGMSSPTLWSEIFRDNKEQLTYFLEKYIDELIEIKEILNDKSQKFYEKIRDYNLKLMKFYEKH